jgi:hypothetical protein
MVRQAHHEGSRLGCALFAADEILAAHGVDVLGDWRVTHEGGPKALIARLREAGGLEAAYNAAMAKAGWRLLRQGEAAADGDVGLIRFADIAGHPRVCPAIKRGVFFTGRTSQAEVAMKTADGVYTCRN